MYDTAQKRAILALARQALGAALEGQPLSPPSNLPAWMAEPRGCFVTLHNGHDLRGCIGTFDARRPLAETLIEMAGAATRDPRFTMQPVTSAELPRLNIEVSILTPLDPMDDPMELRLGTDGIYIIDTRPTPPRSGCFLPQVAVEQGWDVPTTLSYCCAHKMGLPADAWREARNMQFFRFQSIVIDEKELA